jgi:hypothetical protein
MVQEEGRSMATLPIKTAEEFRSLDSLERQASRRTARETPLLQRILRHFADHGGRVSLAEIVAAFPESPPATIRDTVIALNNDDLVRVRDGHVDIAYPFSATPTPFLVQLTTGDKRYACCAMDALGMAPMLGQQVEIRSRCHHCGTPLNFLVGPHGPGPDAHGLMLWFGKGGDERCAADGL